MFSSYEIAQFLDEIEFSEGLHPYETRILPLIEELRAPAMPVTCVIGSGMKTPESLFYVRNNGFDEQPETVYGDGDGTVNMVSLLGLESLWANEKNQSLKVIKIPGISHTSILKDDNALHEILEEICSNNSTPTSSAL